MLFVSYLLIALGYLFLSPVVGIFEVIFAVTLELSYRKYAKRGMRTAAIAAAVIAGINIVCLCIMLAA